MIYPGLCAVTSDGRFWVVLDSTLGQSMHLLPMTVGQLDLTLSFCSDQAKHVYDHLSCALTVSL